MQEHIRRAHPEHYISKLPATEESFLLMIKTQPNDRPQNQPTSGPSAHPGQAKGLSHAYHGDGSSAPGTPRNGEEQYTGAALLPAATALAQLHNHKMEQGWESDNVSWMIWVSLLYQAVSFQVIFALLNDVLYHRTGIRITKGREGRGHRLSCPQYTSQTPM